MIGCDARRERRTVRRRGRDERRIFRHDIKGVDEIDEVAVRNGVEKRGRFLRLELVPAHVRHLRAVPRTEADHAAGKDIEALLRTELLALAEQQLESQADAEKRRLARDDVAHRRDEVVALEIFHARAERADAGQHDAVRAHDRADIAGDLRGVPETLERLLHAVEIAHAVVDDRDHKLPLVDKTPLMRGSMRVAWPSARAVALKHASMMWCGLSPALTLMCRFIPSWFASAWKNSCGRSVSKSPTRPARIFTL